MCAEQDEGIQEYLVAACDEGYLPVAELERLDSKRARRSAGAKWALPRA